jgi:glycosyltransferase involved in cell wall biosynthesis
MDKKTDILCFSHLRWNFVFQRPQHLMSRFADVMRVFFIEEPEFNADQNHYKINEVQENVFVITPQLQDEFRGTDLNKILNTIIKEVIDDNSVNRFWSWYYTPMALPFTSDLNPEFIIYDCMDELSAFRFAPLCLKKYEDNLLDRADLVFTGGNYLYEWKKKTRPHDIYPFPSSIDKFHFNRSRYNATDPDDQKNISSPRIGFFGVIDERLNIHLLESMASLRPEWNFILIGPVVKINPDELPKRSNIHYLGIKNYQDLPDYISGWNVAMMPFALNASTKYTSPTKTPEYLAAGKPVVSTSIRDVVITYGVQGYVHIADTAEDFISAIEWELCNTSTLSSRIEKADELINSMSWDKTWMKMLTLIIDKIHEKNLTGYGRKEQEYV